MKMCCLILLLEMKQVIAIRSSPRCFKRIGLREGFSSIAGTQEYLRQQFGMDEASIVSVAQKLLLKNSKKSDADSLKDEKVI